MLFAFEHAALHTAPTEEHRDRSLDTAAEALAAFEGTTLLPSGLLGGELASTLWNAELDDPRFFTEGLGSG